MPTHRYCLLSYRESSDGEIVNEVEIEIDPVMGEIVVARQLSSKPIVYHDFDRKYSNFVIFDCNSLEVSHCELKVSFFIEIVVKW